MNGMWLRMVIEQIVGLAFNVRLNSNVKWNHDSHDIECVVGDEMGLNRLELGL